MDLAAAAAQSEYASSENEDDEDSFELRAGNSSSFKIKTHLPAPRRAPSFENMCGSTFVYRFSVRGCDLPPMSAPAVTAATKKTRKGKKMGVVIGGGGDRVIDVFSVHGNLTLRPNYSGTSVNIKVLSSLLFESNILLFKLIVWE